MSYVRGFPPIADPSARVLILGSMPGRASLAAQQYYAHPRNAFWRIMSEHFEFDVHAPYAERAARLRAHRVAVWDVVESCSRASSLDSDIQSASVVPNDFEAFFDEHSDIALVCFNGVKAAELYRRHVKPCLVGGADLSYLTLPSTSPANAAIPYTRKLAVWRKAIAAGLRDPVR